MAKNTGTGKKQDQPLSAIGVALSGMSVSQFLPNANNQIDLRTWEKGLIKPNEQVLAQGVPETAKILDRVKNMGRQKPVTVDELQAEKTRAREFQRRREIEQKRQELMDKVNPSYTGSGTSPTLPKNTGKANLPEIEGAFIKPNPITIQNRTEDARKTLSDRHGRPASIEELQAEKTRAREFQRRREIEQKRQELMDKVNPSYTGSGTSPTLPKNTGKANLPEIEGAFIKPNPITIQNRTEDAREILSQRQGPAINKPELAYVQPMPRPDSSSQPSPQYGPYFDMQQEYPITMAGLRQAEFQHDRNAIMLQAVEESNEILEPLVDSSLKAIEKYSESADLVKAAKVGGKALTVIGLAFDVYDVATAFSADITEADQRVGRKTVSAASDAALSWAVSAAAAEAFAIGGAAIGTLIMPGLGTAIGGIIGGVVGGILGAASGREMSGWIMDGIPWEE